QTYASDYYPFGSLMRSQGQPGRFGYQGGFAEFDEETGLNFFQLRMYDAKIGRWLRTDPMRQHASPYLSMSNSPTNSVDPDGGFDFFRNGNGDIRWFDSSAEGFSDADGNSWENVGTAHINISTLPGGQSFITTFQQFGNQIDGYSLSYNTVSNFEVGIDQIQMMMDGLGLFPGLGEPIDAVNGLISLARGDYGAASMSFASTIPFGGWVSGGSKLGKTIVESTEFVAKLNKVYGGSAVNFYENVAKSQLGLLGTAGRNVHDLKGPLAGFKAIDIPNTGKGRGGGRIIFQETDTQILIKGFIKNHDYHNLIGGF
ncbi:MAG: hypothetical protein NXI00_24110, partial [Cytophagales bacterium]|nr:hypothetical protein [Cytophagales bacterium]